jgi:GWxTD domain-containing protein
LTFFTRYLIRYLILLPFLSMLISGCNPVLKITGLDISSLYTGLKENSLQVNQLYNINDSISSITITLPAGLILPDPGTKKYTKKGSLKYEIIGKGKRIGLTDSATFAIADTSEFQSFLTHHWTFKAPSGMDYFVQATYSVPGIQDNFLLLEYFDKRNHSTQSWYRFQYQSGEFVPGNILAYAQPVRLVSEDSSSRKLLVKFYSRNFAAPFPPFIENNRAPFNYAPDSTFYLDLSKGKTTFLNLENTGFYFFQSDTSTLLQGPTLFRVYNGFPRVSMHSLMLEALRYITSSQEFKLLNSYDIPKVAVDSFWIANSGRTDLATELIRRYYQRVETANQLYTSFTEGWKTDRGMIYIVMGKPAKVFRSFEQEVWIYGDYDDPRSLKFYFDKAQNPFTNNDYVLLRNRYYKTPWYQNVQMWRR